MKTAVGVYPTVCIYTWHRCTLFLPLERVPPAPTYYIYHIGVGFYCILFFYARVFLGPQLERIVQYDSYAFSLSAY